MEPETKSSTTGNALPSLCHRQRMLTLCSQRGHAKMHLRAGIRPTKLVCTSLLGCNGDATQPSNGDATVSAAAADPVPATPATGQASPRTRSQPNNADNLERCPPVGASVSNEKFETNERVVCRINRAAVTAELLRLPQTRGRSNSATNFGKRDHCPSQLHRTGSCEPREHISYDHKRHE